MICRKRHLLASLWNTQPVLPYLKFFLSFISLKYVHYHDIFREQKENSGNLFPGLPKTHRLFCFCFRIPETSGRAFGPGTWPADPLTDALSQGEVVKDYVRPAGLVSNVSVSLKGRDALVTNQMTVGPWWISLSASFEETTMYIHSTYLSTFIFLT